MQTPVTKDPSNRSEMPDLGSYMDFRVYLKDFYSYKRRASRTEFRTYNYAVFSAAADIKSPNYLKLIIEGKRNLSVEMIAKFAKALALNKDAAEEFRLLVLYGQETDAAKRNDFLRQLTEVRVSQKLRTGQIDKKVWEKVPNWVAWVVFAMVDQEGVRMNVQQIRRLLKNRASEQEIEAAFKTLTDSGQIIVDEASGEMRKGRTLMESADDVPVDLIRKLQAELMYLGLESLFQDSTQEREFGSMTVSLTRAEFEDLKFQMRKWRKQIHKDVSIKRNTSKGDRVYQLNFQLFPVTESVTDVPAALMMNAVNVGDPRSAAAGAGPASSGSSAAATAAAAAAAAAVAAVESASNLPAPPSLPTASAPTSTSTSTTTTITTTTSESTSASAATPTSSGAGGSSGGGTQSDFRAPVTNETAFTTTPMPYTNVEA